MSFNVRETEWLVLWNDKARRNSRFCGLACGQNKCCIK